MNTSKISSEWSLIDNEGLVRKIKTNSFNEGVTLIGKLAKIADELNHHPDIELSYTQVTIKLLSHDVGKVTKRDNAFAVRVDNLQL